MNVVRYKKSTEHRLHKFVVPYTAENVQINISYFQMSETNHSLIPPHFLCAVKVIMGSMQPRERKGILPAYVDRWKYSQTILLQSVLRIRIRMDPKLYTNQDSDPDLAPQWPDKSDLDPKWPHRSDPDQQWPNKQDQDPKLPVL